MHLNKIYTKIFTLLLLCLTGSVSAQQLHSHVNAASASNEANSTSGWTGAATITSETTSPQQGAYALKATSTSTGRHMEYTFPATVGELYLIKIWAKEGSQSNAPAFANWIGFSGFTTTSISGTTWKQYTFLVSATNTAPIIRIYVSPSGGNTPGNHVFVDNVSITPYTADQLGDNLYTYSNAANMINEANSTTGWSGNATITSSNASVKSGNYALKAATSAAGTDMQLTFNAQIGTRYLISIWAREGEQSFEPAFSNWEGVTGFSTRKVVGTTWKEYVFLVTASASTMVLKVYSNPSASATIGQSVYIDHIFIGDLDAQPTEEPEEDPTTPYEAVTLSDENYMYSRVYQREMTTATSIQYNNDVLETVSYVDGLGRPVQSIGIKASPDRKDMITHIAYDIYGRQLDEWMPYPETTGNLGAYRGDVSGNTQSYYYTQFANDFPTATQASETNPYSRKDIEPSPLNRVLKQAAPGEAWELGSGHEIRMGYETNVASEVRLFTVSLTTTYVPTLTEPTATAYYGAGQLYKMVTKDENWTGGKNHTTEEFKDKEGRVVLKRTYSDTDLNSDGDTSDTGEQEVAHDTYYVYDIYGNLTYVLPPKMNATTASIAALTGLLADLGYQYQYDQRNRLVEKQIPGKGREYIVYNKLDQPVLTKDAYLHGQNQWLFTKYDAFGRVAYTGKANIANTVTRSTLQTAANAITTAWVSRITSPTTVGGTPLYYDNTGGYPTTEVAEVLTVNYYDDYVDTDGLAVPATVYEVPKATSTQGLPTVSKVKVLETSDWITTITGYDRKGRAIYVASNNEYLETADIAETKLDFTGRVKQTKTTHTRGANPSIIITDGFTYDHTGRLLKQTQHINGEDTEVIATNEYDELGQLIQKGVGNTEGSNRLQEINYDYNIRGWLKSINDINNPGADLFNFRIGYNEGTTPLYNGNISQTQWRTANTDASIKTYSYSYDALNRITGAIDNTGHYNLGGFDGSGNLINPITYDKNGNIITLQRQGHINAGATLFGTMDNLVYTYDSGNKLTKVLDNGNDSYGFVDGANTTTEYTYDANGNMTRDYNKGIVNGANEGILYNHLNLPTQVTLPNGIIQYIYDAAGIKLQKIVNETGVGITSTDYAGNYIYENSSLKFFSHAEGYVDAENGNKYVYQYKDHLGNVRLSYLNIGTTASPNLEIQEENNYYPFGLKQKGYNEGTGSFANIALKRKFGGKEIQEELSLGWYDITARNYDPALGRWMNLDPLAEQMRRHSPYNYAFDNPIYFIDPDGMKATDWYQDNDGNVIYDKSIKNQEDLDKAGIDGTYLFDEGKLSGYDEDGNLVDSGYDLNSDGSISSEGAEIVESGFEEVKFEDFSVFGSTEASQNGSSNSELNMLGPTLLASGQPIKALKPIGALGSKPGSSVASYLLSKALPQKLPFKLMGSTVLGRGLGRLIPVVGHSLLIYDAFKSDRIFDPALQGPRDMNKDIKEGVLSTNQMIKKYSCFVKGTKVKMADGSNKNIEDIAIGDEILSVNIEKMNIEVDTVVDIPNTMQKYSEIRAEFSNGVINKFSPAHPFWVKDKGWSVYDVKEAQTELEFTVSKLEKGDIVLFLKNNKLIEVRITELKPTGRTVEMFNVEFVKNNHSFFANGILVHNKRID